MANLTVLNSKEKKEFLRDLHTQFGIEKLPSEVFLKNNKEKIYMSVRELDLLTFEEYTIDRIGLYIGKYYSDGFRPSIDGSQILGPLATKNIVSINQEKKHKWLQGYDIEIQKKDGFYFVKYDTDFLGSGKLKNNELLNSVPKGRRLQTVNEKLK